MYFISFLFYCCEFRDLRKWSTWHRLQILQLLFFQFRVHRMSWRQPLNFQPHFHIPHSDFFTRGAGRKSSEKSPEQLTPPKHFRKLPRLQFLEYTTQPAPFVKWKFYFTQSLKCFFAKISKKQMVYKTGTTTCRGSDTMTEWLSVKVMKSSM